MSKPRRQWKHNRKAVPLVRALGEVAEIIGGAVDVVQHEVAVGGVDVAAERAHGQFALPRNSKLACTVSLDSNQHSSSCKYPRLVMLVIWGARGARPLYQHTSL